MLILDVVGALGMMFLSSIFNDHAYSCNVQRIFKLSAPLECVPSVQCAIIIPRRADALLHFCVRPSVACLLHWF